MKTLLRTLRWLIGCRHRSTYRERRRRHGVDVMHLVCEDCGHARPVMVRSARGHRRAVASRVRPPTAVRDGTRADVIRLDRPRRNTGTGKTDGE